MLNPKLTRNAALCALLLGMTFLAANLYFDLGTTGHRTLANMFFMLAILCDMAFMILIILWLIAKTWLAEPVRPGMPMPGPGAPKKPALPQVQIHPPQAPPQPPKP